MLRLLLSGAFFVVLFCVYLKNGYSVRGVGRGFFWFQKALKPDEPNNERNSFGHHQNSGVNSSVTISFGACRWILASQCTGFASSKFKFFDEI